jgi:hypothetical protein
MMVSRATFAMAALILGATLGAVAASGDDLAPPSLPPGQGQPAVPPAPDLKAPDQSGALSDKLSRSRGVIAPPAVQDKNVMMPPNADKAKMPVIPPPGTPGGDQKVVPK